MKGFLFSRNSRHEFLQESGFTLLELLVVLILISIVIAIASVSLAPAARSTGLESEARRISATLRVARALASIDGRRQTVLIDMDSRCFGIKDRRFESLRPDVSMEVIDGRGGEIQSGVYRISFSPTGAVDDAAVIIWNNKKRLRIETDPVTGSSGPR